MGKVKNLQIVFDGDRDVFFQGDTIRGQVTMTVESSEAVHNFKGVWIVLEGKSGLASGRRFNESYITQEIYFNACLVLLGTGIGELDVKDVSLLPGSHSFPFSLQLPQQPMPSSMETMLGHVRYTATATVAFKRGHETSTVVMINMAGPTVDLNLTAGMELGVSRTLELRGLLGITGHQVKATIGLPKKGYVPGERIYVTCHVDNSGSPKHKRTFVARLVEKITYIVSVSRCEEKRVLAVASSRIKLQKEEKTSLVVGPLLIPPTPATGLPGCNLMDIQYYVKVKDCGVVSHTVKHPVTIGTVPLYEPSLYSGGEPHHDTQTKQAPWQTHPSGGLTATAAPVPNYPMTFEKGVKCELIDDLPPEFVPRYNYFHMPDNPPDASQSYRDSGSNSETAFK